MSAAAAPPPVARLVLATRNMHKVHELRAILAAESAELAGALVGVGELAALGLGDPGGVVESGVTFAENALLKARAVAAASGLPAVADDSGLCVAVLGGSPGVFSARWAGAHGDDAANLALLLAQLRDVPDGHRQAWFECAAAVVTPTGEEHVTQGRLTGTLLHQGRGTGGFGYDPVLLPDGEDRSCAELSPGEKNAISHRGIAFRALAPRLAAGLQRAGDGSASVARGQLALQ